MNAFIKEMIQKQMLRPLLLCEKKKAFCAFAVPGLCLCEFKGCEYFWAGEFNPYPKKGEKREE